MHRSLAWTLVLLVVTCGVPAAAASGAFTRFAGGRTRSDCALVTDVAGTRRMRATLAVCTDGDPVCDADAAADGQCTLAVRVCFGAVLPRCPVEPVIHAELRHPPPALGGLTAALAVMPMPVVAPETCTDAVTVPVSTAGHRRGHIVLRGAVVMASGHSDHDRLVLSCRRPAPSTTATFATIQRQVFAPSCTSLSCHGAASAGGLRLAGDAAYASLVGATPSNDAARAAGLLRVTPGDPARSFLLRKLTGPLDTGEGRLMPSVGIPLPSRRIDLLRRWIAAGAPAGEPF